MVTMARRGRMGFMMVRRVRYYECVMCSLALFGLGYTYKTRWCRKLGLGYFLNKCFNDKFVACYIAFIACNIACDIAFVACDIVFVANPFKNLKRYDCQNVLTHWKRFLRRDWKKVWRVSSRHSQADFLVAEFFSFSHKKRNEKGSWDGCLTWFFQEMREKERSAREKRVKLNTFFSILGP